MAGPVHVNACILCRLIQCISKCASCFFLLIPAYSHLFLLFSLLFFTYYLRLLLITFFDAYHSLSLFLELIVVMTHANYTIGMHGQAGCIQNMSS